MSDGDRGSEPATLGAFGYFSAIALCCIIVAGLAYNFGRQDERRYETPAAYAQAAKADAQRACVNREAAFECIYEKVEASQEQARSEQDLTAQQVAANSAFMSAIIAFFTFIITGIGAWLIRETLIATQSAVKEAEKATTAARDAVDETTRIGEAQIRAYLQITNATMHLTRGDPGLVDQRFKPRLSIDVKNFGQSPARWFRYSVVIRYYPPMHNGFQGSLGHSPRSWGKDIGAGDTRKFTKLVGTCPIENEVIRSAVETEIHFDIVIRYLFEDVFGNEIEDERVFTTYLPAGKIDADMQLRNHVWNMEDIARHISTEVDPEGK
jgi:hypothetical protein